MRTPPRSKLEVCDESQQVWRVGFRPQPWAWPPWRFATNERFSGRWDDPDGNFRTVYAGDSLLACLLEVLACFRPDPQLVSEMAAITTEDDDEPLVPAGLLPRSWLEQRCVGTARLVGKFCAVTHSNSIAALRPKFVNCARDLGLEDFDAAALKDARPRELTQRVALYLHTIPELDGVRFSSRHGDDHRLWAIFERPPGQSTAPSLNSPKTQELSVESPAIAEAFRIHGLSWDDAIEGNPELPLPLVEVDDDEMEQHFREKFGDEGPTPGTPLGVAMLFWLALQDPTEYRPALDYLVYNPADWGDCSAVAQDLVPLSIAENVMNSTDDQVKHVKFIPYGGERSAVALTETLVPDAAIVTVVRPQVSGDWKVWGFTKGWVPTGRQVRGEDPLPSRA